MVQNIAAQGNSSEAPARAWKRRKVFRISALQRMPAWFEAHEL